MCFLQFQHGDAIIPSISPFFLKLKGKIMRLGEDSPRRYFCESCLSPSFMFAPFDAKGKNRYRSEAAPVVAASCGTHGSKVTLLRRSESERQPPFFTALRRYSVQIDLFITIVFPSGYALSVRASVKPIYIIWISRRQPYISSAAGSVRMNAEKGGGPPFRCFQCWFRMVLSTAIGVFSCPHCRFPGR